MKEKLKILWTTLMNIKNKKKVKYKSCHNIFLQWREAKIVHASGCVKFLSSRNS